MVSNNASKEQFFCLFLFKLSIMLMFDMFTETVHNFYVKLKTSVLSISDTELDQGDKEDVPGYHFISNSSSHSEPPRSGIPSSAINLVRRFLK
jgi:hypothetical protein